LLPYERRTVIMARVIFGNHAAVVVRRQDRDRIRRFYCDVLGFKTTRETDDKDDLQLGDDDYFHIGMLYGDFADESEFLRSGKSIYLELKSDDVEAMRQKIIDAGAVVLDLPDPHLYFQAPGGQVFRLVGITEDLTKYERDIAGDEQRNAELAAAARRGAEHLRS
jgi:catechol 2,3-dioxygenase-like lactoylglutathione lyase family enzyme